MPPLIPLFWGEKATGRRSAPGAEAAPPPHPTARSHLGAEPQSCSDPPSPAPPTPCALGKGAAPVPRLAKHISGSFCGFAGWPSRQSRGWGSS